MKILEYRREGLINWSMYVSKGWLSLQLCCNCNWSMRLRHRQSLWITMGEATTPYTVLQSFELPSNCDHRFIGFAQFNGKPHRQTTTARSLQFRCTWLEIKVWDIGRFGLRQRHRLAANEHGSPSIPHPKPWFVASLAARRGCILEVRC